MKPFHFQYSNATRSVLLRVAVTLALVASLSCRVQAADSQQAAIYRDANGEFRRDSSLSFPLSSNGRFTIENENGRTEIHGCDSNKVEIKAVIHGGDKEHVEAVKINVNPVQDEIDVRTELPPEPAGFSWKWLWSHVGNWNGVSVDYIIQVPKGAGLAKISGVNGGIEIGGVSGSITASTVNGRLQIRDAADNLKLSTVNGQIEAAMVSLNASKSVSLDAVNGRIDLALPDNAGAKISASTVNGIITSGFPSLIVEKQFPVGSNLKGRLGDGLATVKASTVNGSIAIHPRKL